MSDGRTSSWRPLPGVNVPGIPGLLVSAEFTPQSYTIRLTDLANLWTESLDKKPIIMAALKGDTSIDPTDGPDQIRKLLDLLRAAFDTSAPEHGDTTLVLSKATGSSTGEDTDSLEIDITVVLPKPLRPLKWTMYLKKAPQSAITTELVLPLVQAHHAQAQEVDELLATLREKDSVITKLIDKLEATGTGLESVFTALSGRRKVTRALAEDRIKGLAPFNESAFPKRLQAMQDEGVDSGDLPSLLRRVFGDGTGLPSGSSLDIGESPALNDWWTKLGRGKSVGLVSRSKEKPRRSSTDDSRTASSTPPPPVKSGSNAMVKANENNDDDDEFQVQSTPPQRNSGQATRSVHAPPADDDETSDGEDAEIPDSLPSASSRTVDLQPTTSRLGAIGGRSKQQPSRKRTPSSPPHSPSPPPRSSRSGTTHNKAGDGDSTASDPDDDDAMDVSPPPAKPKTPPRQVRRIGGGLGRIGGHRPTTNASTPEPIASLTPSGKNTPKRGRLGVIGKQEDGGSEKGRGRTRTPDDEDEEKEEKPRETSQERADRKRAELRKEIERKANTGPAKKKRKF